MIPGWSTAKFFAIAITSFPDSADCWRAQDFATPQTCLAVTPFLPLDGSHSVSSRYLLADSFLRCKHKDRFFQRILRSTDCLIREVASAVCSVAIEADDHIVTACELLDERRHRPHANGGGQTQVAFPDVGDMHQAVTHAVSFHLLVIILFQCSQTKTKLPFQI